MTSGMNLLPKFCVAVFATQKSNCVAVGLICIAFFLKAFLNEIFFLLSVYLKEILHFYTECYLKLANNFRRLLSPVLSAELEEIYFMAIGDCESFTFSITIRDFNFLVLPLVWLDIWTTWHREESPDCWTNIKLRRIRTFNASPHQVVERRFI